VGRRVTTEGHPLLLMQAAPLNLRGAGGGWEDGGPVVLHVGQYPTVGAGLVQSFVELTTDHVLTVIGELASR